MNFTLAAAIALFIAWIVLAFVVAIPAGWVHLAYAAAVVLAARRVIVGAPQLRS